MNEIMLTKSREIDQHLRARSDVSRHTVTWAPADYRICIDYRGSVDETTLYNDLNRLGFRPSSCEIVIGFRGLVALTGPKHCGKSTIALALMKQLYRSDATGNGSRQRFAGPLKAMLRTLGLTEAQVDGDEKELPCELLGGKTPREAMVTLGTEWGRMLIGEDLWVNATMLRVDADLADGCLVVIDDLRFDNEAVAIRKRGGLIIKLERPGVSYSGEHASEVGVSGCYIDHIVPNADEPALVAQHILQLLRKHAP